MKYLLKKVLKFVKALAENGFIQVCEERTRTKSSLLFGTDRENCSNLMKKKLGLRVFDRRFSLNTKSYWTFLGRLSHVDCLINSPYWQSGHSGSPALYLRKAGQPPSHSKSLCVRRVVCIPLSSGESQIATK